MAAEHARLVVVPTAPGAPLAPVTRGDDDELDELVDDLLGEDTTSGPGVADVVLLVAGVVLLVLGLVTEAAVLIVIGVAITLLGAVLPARSLYRRWSSRRTTRRLAGALVLDVGDATTARLAEAYAAIVGATGEADADARESALLAVREAASLLEGRRPSGAGETEYVERRADALSQLARALARRPPPVGDHDRVVQARNELDAATGTGSLAQIQAWLEDHGDATR
jgi:hypothetical protein